MITTTTPPVPLPVGAVSTEEWQPNNSSHYRNFEGEIREVIAGAPEELGPAVFGDAEIIGVWQDYDENYAPTQVEDSISFTLKRRT